MTHKITFNPETGIVEAKVEGTVNKNELKEIQSEVLGIAVEKGIFLYLADYREATVNLSTVEIYKLPALLSKATTALGGMSTNLSGRLWWQKV